MKIGFSKFTDLWPKHCALDGNFSIHSIYVCMIHQNNQLLFAAAGFEENCHDFMKNLVCCPNNRDCMLCICCKCSSKNILEDFLNSNFPDYDLNDTISCKQWVSMDKVDLTSHVSSQEDFISLLRKLKNSELIRMYQNLKAHI